MKTEIYAEMKCNGKVQPIFEGLKVETELRETLAITTIIQTYRNPGSKNIEAVYTFPLPLDAVLLEMEVTLGEKTLKGTVLAKKKAEQRYEDAITDGDAPVMLQNPQPGVYTMNVGNLLPGEKAGIMIRYAMFQRWQGDTLRYHLPTTIAPRYGSAAKAGFEAHQEPESSILVDNLFEFHMVVTGEMAGRLIESPSHEIIIKHEAESRECVIGLARKTGFMDRDLIITVRNPEEQAASAMLCMDSEEYLLWGSFRPRFGLPNDITPRSVKIVVDCSGSMAGDSIAQAREALLRILDELRPQDWFNIVTFGSTATPLFDAQKKVDQETLSYARGFLKNMDADMGGTETASALDMAVRLRCPEKLQQDVLLITDGEIWEWENVVTKAAESGHRFFTVGVGSAVSEAFVRTLADRTGGACELVSPDENMAERIHRHFKRIASPRSSGAEVKWPEKPLRVFPGILPNIYDGDTVNLFAWFSKPPGGEIKLQVTLPDGSNQSVVSFIEPLTEKNDSDATVSRMAAACRLREISEETAGQELAVRYQLVSRWTNYLAVVVRDEEDRADILPELQKVPQMLAAGWGGSGSIKYSVKQSCHSLDRPTFMRDRSASEHVSRVRPTVSFIEDDKDQYDIPAFLRKSVDGTVSSCPPPCASDPECMQMISTEPLDSLESVVEFLNDLAYSGTLPDTLHGLRLPEEILAAMEVLEDEFSEEELVVIFLNYLTSTPAGSMLNRQAKRVISKSYKSLKIDAQIKKVIEERIRVAVDKALSGEDENSACSKNNHEHVKAKFEVFVDDNFNFMQEDERYSTGTFDTYEEAVAGAKSIVDRCLESYYKEGMTAEALYNGYKGYGEDPFIIGDLGKDVLDDTLARAKAMIEQMEARKLKHGNNFGEMNKPLDLPENRVCFSAWDYAEKRCKEMCGNTDSAQ